MDMANTPAEFIDEVGARKLAETLDCDIGVVRVWKARNVLPEARWLELHVAYPELTLDRLRAMHEAAA